MSPVFLFVAYFFFSLQAVFCNEKRRPDLNEFKYLVYLNCRIRLPTQAITMGITIFLVTHIVVYGEVRF